MLERERKFLVPELPGDLIRQGYLAVEESGRFAEVRLRRIAGRYVRQQPNRGAGLETARRQ